jgi:hypothetical protein
MMVMWFEGGESKNVVNIMVGFRVFDFLLFIEDGGLKFVELMPEILCYVIDTFKYWD